MFASVSNNGEGNIVFRAHVFLLLGGMDLSYGFRILHATTKTRLGWPSP
jgi:hypothetical protein